LIQIRELFFYYSTSRKKCYSWYHKRVVL
jgi:hypothetical protein